MDSETTNIATESTQTVAHAEHDDEGKLRPCCEGTISLHAANNSMMVCGTCKQIIKCFTDERAYRNYVKFCNSRHRKFITLPHKGYNVVVFKAYEKFNARN